MLMAAAALGRVALGGESPLELSDDAAATPFRSSAVVCSCSLGSEAKWNPSGNVTSLTSLVRTVAEIPLADTTFACRPAARLQPIPIYDAVSIFS